MELEQLLERATDRGPAHPPIEERIRHARRAARRRTAVRVAGATAVLAVMGAGYAVLQPAEQHRAVEPVLPAASPTVSPTPTPSVSAPTPTQPVREAGSDHGWRDDEWARIDVQGGVTVRRGVTVVDQVDAPLAGATSAALEVVRGESRRYVLVYVNDAGISTAVDGDPRGRALSEFVSQAFSTEWNLPVALHDRGAGVGADLPLVGYDRGRLYTVGGASIVRVVEDPDVAGWCAAYDTAGVELSYQGRTYFAVLGNGNCGGAFAPKGKLAQSLEETIAEFRSVV